LIKKVTIVISYLNSCPYRERNYKFLLSHLLELDIPFIIAEQVKGKNKDDSVENKGKYILIKHYSNCFFKKSFLYNLAFKYVKTPYVWFLDSDIFLNFNKVLGQINNQDAIRPFSSIFQLNEQDSNEFALGRPVDYKKYDEDNYYGKHSLIVSSDIFCKVGGFDEKFYGWGWEDLDFVENKISNIDPFVVKNLNGVHLYHPPAKKENERNNYFTFLENSNSRKKMSFCIFAEKLEDINFTTLNQSLSNNFLLRSVLDFTVVLFGDFHKEISSNLYFNFKKYIKSKFLNIYFCSKTPNKLKDKINNCIYPAEGSVICFWDQESVVKVSTSNSGMSLLSSDNNHVMIDSTLLVKRVAFDSVNGYDYCDSSIEKYNLNLQKKLIKNKKHKAISTYGDRDYFMYFNFNDFNFYTI